MQNKLGIIAQAALPWLVLVAGRQSSDRRVMGWQGVGTRGCCLKWIRAFLGSFLQGQPQSGGEINSHCKCFYSTTIRISEVV